MKYKIVWIIVILSLLASLPAAGQAPALSADKIAKIETAITSTMSKQGIPALTVAIVEDNQIRFQRGYGMADVENYVPAKALTVYRIASVTKPLTAVAAMQLVEKGKLDLDTPVQKYVPSFPTKAFPITTRQVLSHTSGIRNYKPGEGERTEHYGSLTAALAVFKDDPLDFEPGTKYSYTTFGYTLLGTIIEGASGMKYEDYMRENIFKPAGMQHTYVDDIYALIPNRARGYHPRTYAVFNGENRNMDLMDSSYKIPAGGLVSTAEDIARFAIAVQSNVLIKKETLDQMSKSQKLRDGSETGYGYGWYTDIPDSRGKQVEGSIWHGGVQQGFTADLWLQPRKRFAVVILANLEGGVRLGLGTLASQIGDIVLK